MTKTHYIQVRVSEEEKRELQAFCGRRGVSVSEYVRDMLFGAVVVIQHTSSPIPSYLPPLNVDAQPRDVPARTVEPPPLPDVPKGVSVAPVKTFRGPDPKIKS
jgi:hypothetical protein